MLWPASWMPVSGCPFSVAGITDPGYSSSVPDFYLDKPARLRGHFIPMKRKRSRLTHNLTSVSLGVVSRAERTAVVPPPDGGYPGFTTAEGQNALFSLTSGAANTAVGWYSLFSNTEGSFSTATGAGALLFNTANENTAFGAATLLFNTTGDANTAVGAAALLKQHHRLREHGQRNPCPVQQHHRCSKHCCRIFRALEQHTAGANTNGANTAVGAFALGSTVTGGANTAIGYARSFYQPPVAPTSPSAIWPESMSPPAAVTLSLVTAALRTTLAQSASAGQLKQSATLLASATSRPASVTPFPW